jgi:N-acyl-D-aspartate/D-glutamate deacylase
MGEPQFKARVLAADASQRDDAKIGASVIQAFDRMFELGDPPDYEPDAASSIGARAQREGRDALDVAYDVLLQDGGRSFLYLPFLNYADGNLDAVGEMLAHPNTVIGLADGGAHLGTICDASFPTTLLTLWVRDRDRGRLDLPFAVQRHTSATARTVGLFDRGVLAPGYRADVNVIDFEHLRARRPEMHHDLPAGGKRLVQSAEGYVATLVAGEVTYENGVACGPLPGRLVRGPQAAPTNGAR